MLKSNTLITTLFLLLLFFILIIAFGGAYNFMVNEQEEQIIINPTATYPIPSPDIQTNVVPDDGIILRPAPIPASIFFSSDSMVTELDYPKTIKEYLTTNSLRENRIPSGLEVNPECQTDLCNGDMYNLIIKQNTSFGPDIKNMPKSCDKCPVRGFRQNLTDTEFFKDGSWRMCPTITDCYYSIQIV